LVCNDRTGSENVQLSARRKDHCMTATTEPTVTAEVPAWLNLDALCPPDMRDALAVGR